MCPACLTTLAAIAAGTGTAGGLTAVVAKKLHDRRAAKTQGSAIRPAKPSDEERAR